MRLLSVVMTTSLIMASLIGCASSHTKPKHEYSSSRHVYPHATGHYRGRPKYYDHGHRYKGHHAHPRIYHRPPPAPGRTPDGRYVLPGGLESTCAGGTPPPCR